METITACQNVCVDFWWVGPVTEWLRNIALIAGVVIGWRQLEAWRREKVAVKRAELGEELVAVASELTDKIASIRSPIGYGPPDGEEDDGTFDFRRRLREIGALDTDFEKLRHLQVRSKAFFGDANLSDAIDSFFEVRARLVVTLGGRIRMIRGQATEYGRALTDRQSDRMEQYENIIWKGQVDEDPIDCVMNPALSQIENTMIPHIRLEATR
ncbi:hypothetical protein [Thioclava sp. IC9]|uniref:hypothetical protein n=1 Tax=Thioclava sp. IC9 TaxID=1973007 RepID=UPI000B53C0D6|nr:hypothetical protein [Thioclava sp. IC9]OWY03233.1 hypothetical protein B6V76_10285 [Thioclava sp. IC9]